MARHRAKMKTMLMSDKYLWELGPTAIQIPPFTCRTRSLAGLNYLHKAMPGGHGGVKKLAGHQGQHCIVQALPQCLLP